MNPFRRPVTRLRVEPLEARDVPASVAGYDPLTVTVAFRTDDPADPIDVRTVAVGPGETVEAAVARWQRDPSVVYAEPNYLLGTAVLPDDPFAGLLYAQNNTGGSGGTADADMDAAEAWNITTGSSRVVVAVNDTGIDYTHPDLYRNIWINQTEIPDAVRARLTDVDADGLFAFWDLNDPVNIGAGKITDLNGNGYIDGGDLLRPSALGGWADGVDGGGNGYTDDLVGWDFLANDNDPMDLLGAGGGHGTHVAGTIGAVGNNGVGVTGVAWRVQLMALRFIGPDGGTAADAAAAIRYSAANGAAISNNSYGGSGYSRVIADAVAYARDRGQIFVVAAGNDSANNDTTPTYPANIPLDNVVSVAATDRNDRLAWFSNYGRATVDLGAAGVDVLSTYPGGLYATMSGTSMATPQVAGAFALLLSQEPTLGYSQAIGRLLATADPVAALGATTINGGRLNVFRALTGDAGGATGGTSALLTPVVSLRTSDGSAVVGGAVTLTAVVSGVAGPPTGTVTFVNATTGATLGTAALDGSGAASITTSGFAAGSNEIVVRYSGDGTYLVGSAAVTQVAERRPLEAVLTPGLPGLVFVFDGPGGAVRAVSVPFAVSPAGVATGDVNNDGFVDLIVGSATAPGLVIVYSGRDLSPLAVLVPFGPLPGGVTVATGDVNDDGFADLFVAPIGFPVYGIFSGRDQSFLGFGLTSG